MQCCANCTAFQITYPVAIDVTLPNGAVMKTYQGKCVAATPSYEIVQRQVGGMLVGQQAQLETKAVRVDPPTQSHEWCRDGWQHNPEVKVILDGDVATERESGTQQRIGAGSAANGNGSATGNTGASNEDGGAPASGEGRERDRGNEG